MDEEEESKEHVDVQRFVWLEVWAPVGTDRVVLEKLTTSPFKISQIKQGKDSQRFNAILDIQQC